MDLDHFEDINDSLGHAAGDELLKSVAERLRRALRPSDTIGRLSSDEFVVLAEGASLGAGPALIAERLLDVLHEPFILSSKDGDPTTAQVTASIGIATGERSHPEDLIRDADFALCQAKASGRNRYELFAPEMRNSMEGRLILEADLKAALGAGQFYLEYQPTFSLLNMKTVGVEALLRWHHPTAVHWLHSTSSPASKKAA